MYLAQLAAREQEARDREVIREDRLRRLRQLRKQFFEAPLVEKKYSVLQIIGEGASGVVCSAVDNKTGEPVAVKRVSRGFDKVPVSIRLLREIKFLRLLRGHENIVEMQGILLPSSTREFNDVFLLFELMPTDLNHLLRGADRLSDLHIQYFAYQILRGLAFMHGSGVFHRDLKPNNILVNEECSLRICDFGLARAAFDDPMDMVYWTDYVATRWYRAPELIMTHYTKYSTAIDIWSVGCILAEMLGNGKPLFPGRDAIDQLSLMIDVLGSPSEEAIVKVQSGRVREEMRRCPKRRPRPFSDLYPHAQPAALDLLSKLLDFDPSKRPSAAEALHHPYFKELHENVAELPSRPIPKHEFAFERQRHTREGMRKLFLEEILLYHPERSTEYLQGPDRQCGFDIPSQADTFANAMRSVQEGIAQRKTTSMPKHKFKPITDAYLAKRAAERKKAGGEGDDEDSKNATMTDVSTSPSGRVPIGSSASWYGGPSRSTAVNYEAPNVVLDEDPFGVGAVKVEEDMGMVRVNSAGIESVR